MDPRIKKNVEQMINQGAPENDIDRYLQLEGVTAEQLRNDSAIPLEQSMDRETGAPALIRASVGPGHRKTSDRLATLQKYFPDAKPYGDDNFVFTDPQTRRPTLYNPPGMDAGDVAEYGRVAAEMGGGAIGGVAGALTAAPTGMMSAPVTVPAGVGLGAEAAGQIYDLGLEWLGNRVDTRGVGHRTADAGTGVAVNAIGQKLGTELPYALKRGVAGVRNRMAGASGPQLLRDYRAANIPLNGSAASITGSRPIQGTTEALAKLPSSAGRMGNAADDTLNAIRLYSDDVARGFGTPMTKQGAGEVIQKGASNAAARFVNRRALLDDSIVELVGRNTQADIQPLAGLVQKMKHQAANNPRTAGYLNKAMSEAQKVLDDAGENGISFEALRNFRTDLGAKLDQPDVSGYVGKEAAALRQVYGAVKQSLLQTAKKAGPDAEHALKLHDRYVGFNRNINLPDLDKLAKQDAEKAFDFAMNRAKDGGVKLMRLRKNLTPDEWDVVAATTLKRMGTARPSSQGVDGDLFSVDSFLTNWNKLSPEAKRSMFGGTRYKGLAPQLDRLTRVVGSAKDVTAMKNFSGTAQQHVYMQLLMGGGGAVGGYATGGPEGAVAGMAGSIILPNMAARLMTNPKFVSWLAKGVQIAPANYNGMAGHLGRLVAIGEAEPAIQEEVNQFIDAFRTIVPPPPKPLPQRERRPLGTGAPMLAGQ